MSLMILYDALSYKTDTQQIIEIEVHGNEIYMQVKKIFLSFVHIAQYDQRIIQLTLIVLILTKGLSTSDGKFEPILKDAMAVYRAQNYYGDIWKQCMDLEKRFVYTYNKLITQFLTWQMLEKQ